MAIRRFILIVTLLASVGMMRATTAGVGVFTVADGKTVKFATAPEAELVQWSTANAWGEESATTHGGWHVLNHEEWTYLLSDGRTGAADKNNLGTIDGKKGLIILPDTWSQPGSAPTFQPVGQGISFDNNIYTAAEWTLMAAAGAVFLPCQGYKEGETIKDASDHGAYWSSDSYSETQGYSIHFNEGEIHDQNTFASKDLYYSVLLVREASITELDEEDNLATFVTKLAAADDCSFAYVRRTLRKDGTFYTLCLPFDVPNIEDSPLAGAEVFAFAGGTVSGAEGSEVLHLTLTPLAGTRLSAGVPYILRWANTGETLATPLYFASVENWDDDTDAGTDSGNETIKLHGVYPKAHIPGYTSGAEAHYNFFMGANNTLYWPDDTLYPEAQGYNMKGFRAYFYIIPPTPSPARQYSNMQAVWKIKSGVNSTTGVEEVRSETVSTVRSEKILRNGQVVLVIDGKMYDLKGLKIED